MSCYDQDSAQKQQSQSKTALRSPNDNNLNLDETHASAVFLLCSSRQTLAMYGWCLVLVETSGVPATDTEVPPSPHGFNSCVEPDTVAHSHTD